MFSSSCLCPQACCLSAEDCDSLLSGDGLAVAPNGNWIVVVPFTVPGDVVEAKIYRHESLHSYADLVSVKSPGEWRDDSLVKCKYFGKCSGCQVSADESYHLHHQAESRVLR